MFFTIKGKAKRGWYLVMLHQLDIINCVLKSPHRTLNPAYIQNDKHKVFPSRSFLLSSLSQ